MAPRERIREQPAFLLHSVPYSETSLVLDLFTLDYGRVAALAKGAKRPRSAMRAVLLQFQPLQVSYSGKNELRTLTGAEWLGGLDSPKGYGLICAFYLNELLIRLLARDDPHPEVFAAYRQALADIAAGTSMDDSLRRFEWTLLRETGYAPDVQHDQANQPIDARRRYSWLPSGGFLACDSGAPDDQAVLGATLLDIGALEWASDNSRQQARYLTRRILNHCLEGAPLSTRRILMDLQRLAPSKPALAKSGQMQRVTGSGND